VSSGTFNFTKLNTAVKHKHCYECRRHEVLAASVYMPTDRELDDIIQYSASIGVIVDALINALI